ncbi:hypothetical protein ACH5RR_031331 [Cinchona calisaya]|uniref:Uncharacterized protein n=1 Tax=Cinchona calisaya TaxID=153742 RepID=A0ABD2YEW5_9GENT
MTFQLASAQIQGCTLQAYAFKNALIKIIILPQWTLLAAKPRTVKASYYCLCLLLRSATPGLCITLSLQLSSCYISIPPLTQCQKLLPADDLMKPSAPNDFMVPLNPERDEIPLINSTLIDNAMIVAGQPTSISNVHPNLDFMNLET